MKFKEIGGITHVILEENDKVVLKTVENKDSEIEVTSTKDGLDIVGDAAIINKITGNGMLEKIYIPPILSSEEIIAKCDEWLEMFKKVYGKFSELVLTEEYDKQRIAVKLTFGTFFQVKDTSVKGKTIDLDLHYYGTIIKEGMTISINDNNSDIYDYLAISVLNYFITQNFDNKVIDIVRFNGNLISEKGGEKGHGPKFTANIASYIEDYDGRNLVTSLITNYNLGNSLDQIISNLKARIKPQAIPENLERGINYSKKQYDAIFAPEEGNQSRVRRITPQS
ncbi:MAG: hypothetical protein NC483_01385 [Ruminococcus sp.]|nr:hypothetical protein [Ruminococcus sp.]